MLRVTKLLVGLLPLLAIVATARAADRNARVEAILPKLARIAADYRIRTQTPGLAVAVVTPDKVYFINSGRTRAVSTSRPVDEDTVFQVASVSKAVTGTYIAKLVTDGKVAWNDRIVDLLPWFRFASKEVTDRVTVLDMMTQRTGMIFGTGAILEDLGHGQRFVLEHMRYIDPSNLFRKKWAYVNFGITIGGVAAAATTGQKYPASIAKTLFAPLGMRSTSAAHGALLRHKDRAEMNYILNGKARPIFVRNADVEAPAAAVNSTSRDLSRLLQVYLNDGNYRGTRFLSRPALERTIAPITLRDSLPKAQYYYGVGWEVRIDRGGGRTVYHGGTFSGMRTYLSFKPEQKIGIVVLGNAFWGLPPEAVEDAFYQLYSTGRVKPHTLEKFTATSPALTEFLKTIDDVVTAPKSLPATLFGHPLSAYAGTYANDFLGQFVVTQTGSGLDLFVGPLEGRLPMRLVNGKLYVINKSGDVFPFVFSGFDGTRFTKLTVEDGTVIGNGWSVMTRIR